MEAGNVVQNKNGKLYMVVSKVGKHQLELREVKNIAIQMHCDSSSVSMVAHKGDYEVCKQVNVTLDGCKLDVLRPN